MDKTQSPEFCSGLLSIQPSYGDAIYAKNTGVAGHETTRNVVRVVGVVSNRDLFGHGVDSQHDWTRVGV